MDETEERYAILGNLASAVSMLQSCPEFTWLIPEVRVNVAHALTGAKTPEEVAAVDGRITVVGGLPHASGMPAWGASDHLARRILEIRNYNKKINAAMNFKCDQEIIEVVQHYCSERSLLFGWLDRSQEPQDVKASDGASMPWKVKQLVAKYGAVPRLFYEEATWGKEPLFLAVGRDSIEVAATAVEIAKRHKQSPY